MTRWPSACAGFLILLSLVAVPVINAASASAHTSTTETWTPSGAPLPSSLPSGAPPKSSILYDTSCSSTSFCVAVGNVSDGISTYPLVETYSGGAWTPSLAPLPQGYGGLGNGRETDASLSSVSCADDGDCAAAGMYFSSESVQSGLLETLSSGSWMATEASLPTSLPGIVNLNSVSCADASTCMAVGDWAGRSSQLPLAYLLTSDSWTILQTAPLPSNFGTGINLLAASCPSDSNCEVVGSYGDDVGTPTAGYLQGLILSYTGGNWSVREAPVPSDGENAPASTGGAQLNAVDCVSTSDCVAGGWYIDTNQNYDPLLITLSNGAWTPSEAPVPVGIGPYDFDIINGISCPQADACVAAGSYQSANGTINAGTLLTESSGVWSATSAPISASQRISTRLTSHSRGRKAALNGISCKSGGFCRAVGQNGDRGLIERLGRH